MDSLDRQVINNAVNNFIIKCSREPAYALAQLYRNGMLNADNVAAARKLALQWEKAEEEAKKKQEAEAETRRKEQEKPDSKLRILCNQLSTQPERAVEYIQKYNPVEDIILYLGDMKKRPLHYHSIYHGKVAQVIQFIEFELAKREIRKENTAKQKSETAKTDYSR